MILFLYLKYVNISLKIFFIHFGIYNTERYYKDSITTSNISIK